jgi:hypothetical protein
LSLRMKMRLNQIANLFLSLCHFPKLRGWSIIWMGGEENEDLNGKYNIAYDNYNAYPKFS